MPDHPPRPDVSTEEPSYLAAHLEERLATDPRVNEPELEVLVEDDAIVVDGVVPTAERHDAVSTVLEEACPGRRIDNRTRVADYGELAVGEGEAIS